MRQRLCLLTMFALLALATAPVWAGHLSVYNASFELDGFQEVPRVDSDLTSNCIAILEPEDNLLSLSCTADFTPTLAHIHEGFPGVAGPIAFPLEAGRIIQTTITLTDEELARAIVGGYYVNLHTDANPAGENRGQLIFNDVEGALSEQFSGSGANEVPPVDNENFVACRAFADNDADPMLSVTCIHNVTDATMAHVHVGSPDRNGPILFAFADAASPLTGTFDLTDNFVDFLAGNLYVNVHTEANPGGEARANMNTCIASDNTLCLQGGRFSVTLDAVVGLGEDAEEIAGVANNLSDASGTFSLFSTDNKEMLVKVLDACGFNERYWVFYAATTNVAFDVTVTDTLSGVSQTYSNPAGQAAAPVQDTDAFPTCP